jgi:hypothetical protein
VKLRTLNCSNSPFQSDCGQDLWLAAVHWLLGACSKKRRNFIIVETRNYYAQLSSAHINSDGTAHVTRHRYIYVATLATLRPVNFYFPTPQMLNTIDFTQVSSIVVSTIITECFCELAIVHSCFHKVPFYSNTDYYKSVLPQERCCQICHQLKIPALFQVNALTLLLRSLWPANHLCGQPH